ncbi:MAG: hypothetical protein WBO70_07165 [Erysipelotrichaceae bacterium]
MKIIDKGFKIIVLSIVLFSSCVVFPKAEEVKADIYISTIDQWNDFAKKTQLDSYSVGKTVVLKNDINADGELLPVSSFSGTFDGLGHQIKGVKFTDFGSNLGIFRYIQQSGVVKNLKVVGVYAIKGTKENIGGVVGVNNGLVTDCSFSGTINGENKIGGIVGVNEKTGIVVNSKFDGKLVGTHFSGGIAGFNLGEISNCNSSGSINTVDNEIEFDIDNINLDKVNDIRNANVSTDAGGIAGYSSGFIYSCTNDATVGYNHVGYNNGGIVGRQSGYIVGSSNNGAVYGRRDVGGICGQMEPYLTINYSKDVLQNLNVEFDAVGNILSDIANLGSNTSSNINSYVVGATNHLDNASNNLSEALKLLKAGNGTLDELNKYMDETKKQVGLMNDQIRLLATTVSTSGKEFSSQISGLNSRIRNIRNVIQQAREDALNDEKNFIEDTSIYDDGTISKGKLERSTNKGIVTGDNSVGGIVGNVSIEYDVDPEEDINITGKVSLNSRKKSKSLVINNYNYGEIIGKKDQIGGIVGKSDLGLVKNGYNYSKVTSSSGSQVGGIAGLSNCVIDTCYSISDLSGLKIVGGIAGESTDLKNCYSMSSVSAKEEQKGAISGKSNGTIADNYFVYEGLGGIDNISYDKKTNPKSYNDFIALSNIPLEFKNLKMNIHEKGKLIKTIEYKYGDKIDVKDLPIFEDSDDYYKNISGINFDYMTRSYNVEIEHVKWKKAISTKIEKDQKLPRLVLEGDFYNKDSVNYSSFMTVGSDKRDYEIVKVFINSNREKELKNIEAHWLVDNNDSYNVYITNDHGEFELHQTNRKGRYLIFNIDNEDSFYIIKRKSNDWFTILLFLGVVTGIVFFVKHQKNKKQQKLDLANADNHNEDTK